MVDALDQLGLDRVGVGLDAEPAPPRVGLGDVVVVVVGQQQVLDVEPEPLGGVEQRPRRAARVDHHPRSALAVGNEIRVRQPVGMH